MPAAGSAGGESAPSRGGAVRPPDAFWRVVGATGWWVHVPSGFALPVSALPGKVCPTGTPKGYRVSLRALPHGPGVLAAPTPAVPVPAPTRVAMPAPTPVAVSTPTPVPVSAPRAIVGAIR